MTPPGQSEVEFGAVRQRSPISEKTGGMVVESTTDSFVQGQKRFSSLVRERSSGSLNGNFHFLYYCIV